MDLSIIVPVYNVEPYLNRCLDSIFQQGCQGAYEVIAIDDGSTDGSIDTLKAYQRQQPGLTVLEHGKNRTLSVARTTGMSVAKGRYVMHVDSDDWLPPSALNSLLAVIDRVESDVIVFNHYKAWSTGKEVAYKWIEAESTIHRDQSMLPHFFKSVWNKLVRAELLRNMVYHNVRLNHSEDFIFGLETFIRAKTITLLPGAYYVYFQNPESLTKTNTPGESIARRVGALRALKDIKERYGSSDGLIDAALAHQVKWIHKEFAYHGLSRKATVRWDEVLLLVTELDGNNALAEEIARSVSSLGARIQCLRKYWGTRWVTGYIFNGLLLPRIGLGWKKARNRV